MTKQELADKVRAAARDVASRADKPENATPMALKYSDILFKFPKLQETLTQLMSEEFTIFVDNIEWVAPRPTTFKVVLKNQNYFHLIWNTDNFIARISGTNYNLSATDDYIGCNTFAGSFTLSLPAANSVSSGKLYIVKDEYGACTINPLLIAPNGADKIDGVNASYSLNVNFESVTLVCNGADSWFII